MALVVAGGYKLNSVEMFDCSRRSWAALQPMKECREGASSFVYKNRITVTGGYTDHGGTDSMESVAISPGLEFTQWLDFPARLPDKLYGHCSVICKGRLIAIGGFDGCKYSDSMLEVSLDPPYTAKVLTRMPEAKMYAGVEFFNDKMLIVGGKKTYFSRDSVGSVTMYDINKNECKQMAPLPFAVSEMATASWGDDNLVVIGGADKDGKALDTAVIYNVHTEKSHMLPAMSYKRKGCAAVGTGDAIFVMGGQDEQGNYLNSVESFSFDRYSWEEFPPMNRARALAIAVAW